MILRIPLFSQTNLFEDELVSNTWNAPTGLTFDPNGQMYVWEKGGLVHVVDINGAKKTTPLLNITSEVLNYGDHGLNGFALDPSFLSNGYFYVLYVAKRHHVLYYGTPNYNINNNDGFKTTIGRLVRYTADISTNFTTLIPNSRTILIGSSISNGIPILVDNHGVGSIVFSPDGSLLLSVGDVSFPTNNPIPDDTSNPWFLEAISVGIIDASQNINSYRSQYLGSLNGKILRINPTTGSGVSSNPYFDSNNPKSPQSRIWALGLRNPFRFTIRPNTASTDSTLGQPGTLYIGDVGWTSKEEINVAETGGINFGWPTFEGIDVQLPYYQSSTYSPSIHTKPKIEWRTGSTARAVIHGSTYSVGTSQFSGINFGGNASIGGIFYTGTQFPSSYQGKYLSGDYEGWVKMFGFDGSNEPQDVIEIVSQSTPTCFAMHPINHKIYYTSYNYPSTSQIRRIGYNINANQRPSAVISGEQAYGASPLAIQLDGSQSFDIDNDALVEYKWTFSDNSTTVYGSIVNVNFTSPNNSPFKITATLKVTDARGGVSSTTRDIFLNNTPPVILTNSIHSLNTFFATNQLIAPLTCTVSDAEHTQSQLSISWNLVLFHEEHSHLVDSKTGQNESFTLLQVPCDGHIYYYGIQLIVSDPLGLKTTLTKYVQPVCPCSMFLDLINPIHSISSGQAEFIAQDKITANNLISGSSSTLFQSGGSIELEPGFQVNQGSVFKASILPCTSTVGSMFIPYDERFNTLKESPEKQK